MGQNDEQQAVQLLEEREGNGVFPEDDEIVVGRAEIERYDEEERYDERYDEEEKV